MHERALAAAGRADNGYELAFLDITGDIIKGANFFAAEMIDFADVAEFYESHAADIKCVKSCWLGDWNHRPCYHQRRNRQIFAPRLKVKRCPALRCSVHLC